MPATVKERVKDFIPNEVVDKIATENDAKTVDELRAFLQDHEHPIVQKWKEVTVEAEPEVEEAAVAPTVPLPTAISAGGFKIILKNAKIHAEKLIIKREKTKR